MLTRIVKMTFIPGKVNDFLSVFNENKTRIAAFEGCEQLALHRDLAQPNIYFTISNWRSEEYLEKYRHSELFRTTWARTKVLFEQKAEAWSIEMC